MTEFERLVSQNAYLKKRCAQLQSDLVDVIAENTRLKQMLERAGTPPSVAHLAE